MCREPELKQVLALPRPDACGRQGFGDMWSEPELKQDLALPRPDACGRQDFSYMCREPEASLSTPEPVCGFV